MAQLAAPEPCRPARRGAIETPGERKLNAEKQKPGWPQTKATYQRLKAASATPGVVAGNDLEVAQKAVEADRARLESVGGGAQAAKSALKSMSEIEGYLQVRAHSMEW